MMFNAVSRRMRTFATEPVRLPSAAAYGIPGATLSQVFEVEDRLPQCAAIIARLAPMSLLDVGCGDGFFLRSCIANLPGGAVLGGIERDPESAETARSCGIDCRVSELEAELPFDDATWDCVFAGEIIEHLADTDHLLAEIWRVLKPGGHLLLTTPNLLAWYNRLLILFGVTPMFVEHSYYAAYGPSYSLAGTITPPVGHLRIFNYLPLRMVVQQNGFDVVETTAAARLPVRCLWRLDRAIARLRPQWGAQLMVLARKADRKPIRVRESNTLQSERGSHAPTA